MKSNNQTKKSNYKYSHYSFINKLFRSRVSNVREKFLKLCYSIQEIEA